MEERKICAGDSNWWATFKSEKSFLLKDKFKLLETEEKSARAFSLTGELRIKFLITFFKIRITVYIRVSHLDCLLFFIKWYCCYWYHTGKFKSLQQPWSIYSHCETILDTCKPLNTMELCEPRAWSFIYTFGGNVAIHLQASHLCFLESCSYSTLLHRSGFISN